MDKSPVRYEYRWLNPGNQLDLAPSMFEWKLVEPHWNGTVEQKVEELNSYRYNGNRVYETRALIVLEEQTEESSPEWINGVPYWSSSLIAKIKRLTAELDSEDSN